MHQMWPRCRDAAMPRCRDAAMPRCRDGIAARTTTKQHDPTVAGQKALCFRLIWYISAHPDTVDSRLVGRNVAKLASPPAQPQREQHPPSVDQVRRLLETATGTDPIFCSVSPTCRCHGNATGRGVCRPLARSRPRRWHSRRPRLAKLNLDCCQMPIDKADPNMRASPILSQK